MLKGQSGAHASSIAVNTADLPGPNGPTFSDNEDGQLIGPGRTEGTDAILALPRDDWRYPVIDGDLVPDDPHVNTATENTHHWMSFVMSEAHLGMPVAHRSSDRGRRPSVEGGIV